MVSILNFKKTLFRSLNNHQPLKNIIKGVFSNISEYSDLPIIKLIKLKNSIWDSTIMQGKVYDVTFEIVSDDESSIRCMQIMEHLEEYLMKNSIRPYKFIIHKVKVMSTQIFWLKAERLWIGEVTTKFWLENIH